MSHPPPRLSHTPPTTPADWGNITSSAVAPDPSSQASVAAEDLVDPRHMQMLSTAM